MTPSKFFEEIDKQIGWLPDWGVSICIFALLGLLALVTHRIAFGILARAVRNSGLFQRSFVTRTRGLARAALLVLAMGIASAIAPLNAVEARPIGHFVQVGFIVLVGWTAIIALHIAMVIYTRQFKLDASDNLTARKHVTQTRILERAAATLIIIITLAASLMTFDSVRQFGVSLLASAGAAGLVLGFALQSILANLVAGVQIAITQPIKLDDVVIVEDEWGWIEEITATYVVVRIWDLRRLIVPIKYFIDHPFQNWTRQSANLLGTVLFYMDYTVPLAAVRAKLDDIVAATALWDKKVAGVQVTDTTEHSMQVRILVSAKNSSDAWDLRCLVREKMLEFLQEEYPHALPRNRAQIVPGPAIASDDVRSAAAGGSQ